MSATNRHGLQRHPGDFYETPSWAIDPILDVLGVGPDFKGYVIDPGCGNGNIAHRVAIRAPKADVRGVELNPELVTRAKNIRSSTIGFTVENWLTWQPDGPADLNIGNPPYQETRWDPEKPLKCSDKTHGRYRKQLRSACPHCINEKVPLKGGIVIVDEHLAEKFIRRALSNVSKKGTVAMLLRDSYMVPKTRRALREEFGLPDRYALERRPSFNGSGTDATDYSWHVWGPKRSGKWSVLSISSLA